MHKVIALTRTVLLISAFLLATTAANAATLYGKVESVDEGDVLTVSNLNRSIKIRLLGIDAPEKDQPLAEESRLHLATLVLNKFIVVHYTGLGQNGFILGRVVLDEMDVCAQMLRDGVAWYDANNAARLSPQEQNLYAASAQAARTELRGIWNNPTPVAPWDFRRAMAENRSPKPVEGDKLTNTSSGHTQHRPNHRASLDNFSTRGPKDDSGWKTLTPSDFGFSILVPGNAVEQGVVIPVTTDRGRGDLDFNVSEGSSGNAAYMVVWAKGPKGSESNASVIEKTAKDIGRLLDLRLKRMGNDESFDITYQGEVKVGSLRGRQYQISITGLSGVMQVFSSHRRNERQLYVLCVMNARAEEKSVKEFFDSLVVTN
jgi:endonuclease YncB( thermonuclease family)